MLSYDPTASTIKKSRTRPYQGRVEVHKDLSRALGIPVVGNQALEDAVVGAAPEVMAGASLYVRAAPGPMLRNVGEKLGRQPVYDV